MSDPDRTPISCRSCGHPLGCAREVRCAECGLIHSVQTSTPRDRLPSLRFALMMVVIAVCTAAGIAVGAIWLRHNDAAFAEVEAAGRQNADAYYQLTNAILNDASRDSKQQDLEAFKALQPVIGRVPIMPRSRWHNRLGITAWVSSGMAFLAAGLAAVLAWTTRVHRYGELTEEQARTSNRLVAGWAALIVLGWLLILLQSLPLPR